MKRLPFVGACSTAARSAPACGSRLLGLLALLTACGGRTPLDDGAERATHGSSAGVAGDQGGAVGVAGVGASGAAGGAAGSGGVTVSNGGASSGTEASAGVAGMPNVTPLWRMSNRAYCAAPGSTLNRNPIWSDERGVYLLTTLDSGEARIDFNGGAGWRLFSESQKSPTSASLTGFSGGPLLEYGSSTCAITFVDENSTRCSAASSQINAVSVVDSRLAYAVYRDRVLRFDGQLWTQWGDALDGNATTEAWGVWASQDALVVVAGPDNIFFRQGMQMQPQKGFPHADYRAVWGFGADDLWVGNEVGQLLHFDGRSWSVAATVPGACVAIRTLWGQGGALFFTTDHAFGTLSGGSLRMLANFPCDGSLLLRGAWGNSKDEVFFASQSYERVDQPCAGIHLMWFDGANVKPL